MQKDLLIVITLFFLHSVPVAQTFPDYPKNYFRNPMDIPIELTGNFGELRTIRWHMGFDIRTNQKENLPVYAAADGYIDKIKIEPFGFGRSIFIVHPNGLTTVYAHLNDFFPELEKYVTEQQYKQETWTIEIDLPKDRFKVLQSQLIAYSGNSGASQGPHLHFEIRDTKSGRSLNPMFFGFQLEDKVTPEVLKLALYDRSRSVYDQSPQIFTLRKTQEGYIIPNVPVIETGLKKISFAIQALDRVSGSKNPNGIYAANIYMDGQSLIVFELDSINYEESSYINAQVDHKHRSEGGVSFQHISLLPGDRGVVYKKIKNNGVITLNDTSIHVMLIEVFDAYMNKSLVNFNIRYIDSLSKQAPYDSIPQQFVPNRQNVLKKSDFEIDMPVECLYDTVRLQYTRSVSKVPFSLSAIHVVNDLSIPVHSNFIARIKPDKIIQESWENKLLIQRSAKSCIRKAVWQGDWLTARFSDFGSFQLFVDTIPPQINDLRNANIKAGSGDTIELSTLKKIVFNPTDNFGLIKNFRAELNGRWIRFANDKGSAYVYTFDERFPYGVHHLKVKIEDLAGNITSQSWWIKRKPYTPPPKKKTVPKKVISAQKKQVPKKN